MSKNFLKTVSGASSSTATVKNPAGTRFLNLREAPSYTANVLGIFYNGATCQVINRQADGWWQVCGDSYEALGHTCAVTP